MVNPIQEYLKEITTAMPITTFQKIGSFDEPQSFTDFDDLKLLNSEKAVQKIKEKFSKTKYNFDFYFVNVARNHKDFLQKGEVNLSWLQVSMPDLCDWMSKNSKTFNPKAITIIYTNNVGDNKIPMTSWIIAHRMAHVFTEMKINDRPMMRELNKFLYRLSNLICDIYGIEHINEVFMSGSILKPFLSQIGTFRSARENNITSPYEFFFECFAQLLLTGKIKFNVPTKSVVLEYHIWGDDTEKRYPIMDDGSKNIERLANRLPKPTKKQQLFLHEKLQQFFLDYEAFCNKQLRMAVGKIFVM